MEGEMEGSGRNSREKEEVEGEANERRRGNTMGTRVPHGDS